MIIVCSKWIQEITPYSHADFFDGTMMSICEPSYKMHKIANTWLACRKRVGFALVWNRWFKLPICLTDIDECANETLCGSHAFCDNTDGSFRCLCDRGYENSPSGHDCVGKSHSASVGLHYCRADRLPVSASITPLCLREIAVFYFF